MYRIYCKVYVRIFVTICPLYNIYDSIFFDEHLYRNAVLWKNQWTRYRLGEDHPIKKQKEQKKCHPWEWTLVVRDETSLTWEKPYWLCLPLTNAALLVRGYFPKLGFFADFLYESLISPWDWYMGWRGWQRSCEMRGGGQHVQKLQRIKLICSNLSCIEG